ncbi:MAG: hypothetical protein J6I79_08995 [Paludibacteraceae bacterium]|nr:hypothetical protein [Paludibacteraceae bacterium]
MRRLICFLFTILISCASNKEIEVINVESNIDSTGHFGVSDLALICKINFTANEEYTFNKKLSMPLEPEVLKHIYIVFNADTLYGIKKEKEKSDYFVFYVPCDHICSLYKERYIDLFPNTVLFLESICKNGTIVFNYNNSQISSKIEKDLIHRYSISEMFDD